MLNGYLAGKYLGQQQTPDQNNPISQALGLGASQGSVGPTNYNAALMGGVPQGMQQFFQSSQPGDALGSGLFGLDQ